MSKRERDDTFGARGDMGMPCNRIFVYGLPYSMDWQQLSDHFSGAGKITYAGIKTDDKGQSRGFGVVEFERIDEATRAIDRYNGSNIGSRVIKVRYDTKETTAGGPDPADNQPTKYARQEPPQSYGMVAPMAIPMAIPMGGVGSGGGGNVMVGPSAGAGYGLLPGYTYPGGMPGGVLNYGTVGYGNGFIVPVQGVQGGMQQQQQLGQMMPGSDGMMMAPGMMGMGQSLMAPGMGGGVGQYGMGMPMGGMGNVGGGMGSGGGSYGGGAVGGRGEKGSCLFVSNMAYSTGSQRLIDVFGRYGVIANCNVMIDRQTGKSKGCATVEFQFARDAYAATRAMQNTTLDGRTIYVREDSLDHNDRGGHQDAPSRREPEPAKKPLMEWGDRSSPLGPGMEKRDCQIVVHGLNYCADVNDLMDFLRDAGPILHARIMIDSESKSRGWGTVLFNSPQCAERCLDRFDKVELKGRKITIKRDEKA